METLKKELINLDKKRLGIRNNYRDKMRDKFSRKISDEKDYVFFPKFLVSSNNEQLRYGISWLQNGFILKIDENVIVVDPSVNFLLRLTESQFDLTDITHIFISHKHLDHSSDADAIMDFMLRAGADTKIIAPLSVFESKVISDFHSGLKPEFPIKHKAIIAKEGDFVELNNSCKMEFLNLTHSVETLAFKIHSKNKKIVYLSDTSYSKKIKDLNTNEIINIHEIRDFIENGEPYEYNLNIKKFVKDSNVLISNVDSVIYTKNSKTHLPLLDLINIVEKSNLDKLIIAHINPMGELKYDVWAKKIMLYTYSVTDIQTFLPDNNGLMLDI